MTPSSPTVRGWHVFVVCLALTVLGAWNLLEHLGSRLPSDLGDPALNTWLLWWNAHAVPLTERWWNAPMFWPMPGAMALSESLLGFTPLTSPLQWLGLSPVATYNIAFLLAAPLSGLGAFFLARRLTGRDDAAWLAAIAFAFNPYRLAHLPQLQMLWALWLPLTLAALHGYLDTRRRGWLVLAGASWLMNAVTNGYYLAFLPVMIGAWLVWFARDRRTWSAIGVTFTVASLPLLPLLQTYAAVQQRLGLERGIDEMQRFSADLTALVATGERAAVSRLWTRAATPEGELYPGVLLAALAVAAIVIARRRVIPATARRRRWHAIGLGLVATAVVLAGVVAWTGGWTLDVGPVHWSAHRPSRFVSVAVLIAGVLMLTSTRLRTAWHARSARAFYLVAAAGAFVLAMGPNAQAFGYTLLYKAPYSWLMAMPGGASMRVPARFGMLMMLALAIVAAQTWSRLVPVGRRRWLALATLAILAEGWIVLPVVDVPSRLDAATLPPGTPVLSVPMPEGFAPNTAALIRTLDASHPLVNGFSGYEPPHFTPLHEGLAAGDESVLTALQSAAGAYAIIGPNGRPEMRATLPAPPSASDPELTIARATASNGAPTHEMFDGRRRSWWHTDGATPAGTALTLEFDAAVAVSMVEWQMGAWTAGAPGDLEVLVDDGPTTAPVSIWRGSTRGLAVIGGLTDPRAMPVRIAIPAPHPGRRLTLITRAGSPLAWAVAEIKAYGRQRQLQ